MTRGWIMRTRHFLLGILLVVVGAGAGIGVIAWKPHLLLTEKSTQNLPPVQWEATLFLPTSDNQGKPYTQETWNAAMNRLVTKFGGATLMDPKEGFWVNSSKKLIRETVRPIVMTFDPSQLDEYRRAVRDVGKMLNQEAMYVRFDQCRVDLLETK